MKLVFIEVCGFRGFRDKVRFDFGSGFTVVTGRNGVGKSTLCDALEFALTGSIDKYVIEKAAKESLIDYVWWRGDGYPAAHYATAHFVDENGSSLTVTRRRETGLEVTRDLEEALCFAGRPEHAIRQLCRTSIIRDEWIAALSVDLNETERFDLVRSAIGPFEGAHYLEKARALNLKTKSKLEQAEFAYQGQRTQLNSDLTYLAEARDSATHSFDVVGAMSVLDRLVGGPAMGLVERLTAGRAFLVAGRSRLADLAEAAGKAREVLDLRASLQSPEWLEARRTAEDRLARASRAKAEAEVRLGQARRGVERETGVDAIANSLAALVEHGEKLGLADGHCPLCAAPRTHADFHAGLEAARAKVDGFESNIRAARQNVAQAELDVEQAAVVHNQADSVWGTIQAREASLVALETALVQVLSIHKLDRALVDPLTLDTKVAEERSHLIDLERALMALEGSQTVSRIARREERVSARRRDMEKTAEQVRRSKAARTAAVFH